VPDAASRRPVQPLVRFRGAPGTRVRRTRAVIGSRPTRMAFRRPSGGHPPDRPSNPKVGRRPLLRFRSSSETYHRSPAPPRRPNRPKSVGDLPGDAASPGLPCPTTLAGPVDTRRDGGSLRHRMPRAGFGYPLRGFHHRASRRRSVGASMGFTLQDVPLVRERYLFRGPCPPDLAAPASPASRRSQGPERSGLQGLVPATSPCRRRVPEGTRPSMPSWGFPLQSFLPICPGHRL
jgi:hypothetical protein